MCAKHVRIPGLSIPNMLGEDKVKCGHRDNIIPAKKLLMAQRNPRLNKDKEIFLQFIHQFAG